MTTGSADQSINILDSEIWGLSVLNICLAVAALSIPTTAMSFVCIVLGGGLASIFEVILLCITSFFTAKLFTQRNIVPQKREFVVVAIVFIATGVFGLLQLAGLLSAINGEPGLVADMGGSDLSLTLSNYFNPFIPAAFCFFSWYKKPLTSDISTP